MNRLAMFRWNNQLRLRAQLSTSAKHFEFMANKGFQIKNSALSLSSGIFGHLSESSVMCRTGGSVLHASVNSARANEPSESGLPLTVDYRARQYAFGVIPTGKNRREIHGSQDELLVARFIDRAVRPLFPKGYVNEIQITVTAHAADGIHDPTVAAVNAASYALMKSNQPWNGPIGCVRVGLIDGVLKVDPSLQEMETSALDFLYAGTASRALMIETAANQVPDATIKAALRLAHGAIQDIIAAQNQAIGEERAEKVLALEATAASKVSADQSGASVDMDTQIVPESSVAASAVVTGEFKRMPFVVSPELKAAVKEMGFSNAAEMYAAGGLTKQERGRGEGRLRGELLKSLAADPVWSLEHLVVRKMAVDSVLNSAFRGVLLEQKPRIDGRTLNQLRDISCAVEVMPTVHGSAYFARGDTHVLSTTTLGSKTDAMEVLPISGTGEVKETHFMLHYDFPPYCTGEMGNVTAVNRRMVGHGKLAERAVRAVMPSVTEFPYTVRVFSECTSSNGSSSMASVCSASLALMDAGVPIHAPVAGLSVGLITHENLAEMLPALEAIHSSETQALTDSTSITGPRPYVLLKDILGTEDHNGDMDFKIAGSATGVTAIQLDVKLEGGVPLFMLEEALDVAREGRVEILSVMSKTISTPNDDFKSNAPRAELVKYDPERRSQLTGVGGEMVKYLQELFTVEIDTTVEGVAYIFGRNAKNVSDCRTLVQDIAVLVKVGDVMSAQVLEVKDFGLLMKVNRAQEGLLHVSDISHDPELIKRPLDELFKVGQRLDVKVYSVDKATGTLKVSRKGLLDPKNSVPDHIRSPASSSAVAIEDLPTFPVIPPRKFSKEYFTNNVATPIEIKAAMTRYKESRTDVVVSEGAATAAVNASTVSAFNGASRVPINTTKRNSSLSKAKTNSAEQIIDVSSSASSSRLVSSVQTRIIKAALSTPATTSTNPAKSPVKESKPETKSATDTKGGLWERLRQTLVTAKVESGRPEKSRPKENSQVIARGKLSNVENKLSLQPIGAKQHLNEMQNRRNGLSYPRSEVSSRRTPPPSTQAVNSVLRDSIARTYIQSSKTSNSRIIGGGNRPSSNNLPKPDFRQPAELVSTQTEDNVDKKQATPKPTFDVVVKRLKESRVEADNKRPILSDLKNSIQLEKTRSATERADLALDTSTESVSTIILEDFVRKPLKAPRAIKTKKDKKAAQPVVGDSVVESVAVQEVTAETTQSASVLAAALNKLVFSEQAADSTPAIAPKKKKTTKSSKSVLKVTEVEIPTQSESTAPVEIESPKPKRKTAVKKSKSAATEADGSASETVATEFTAAAEAIASDSSETSPKKRKTATKKSKATLASGEESLIGEVDSAAGALTSEGEETPKKRKTAVRKPKALKQTEAVEDI